MLPNAHVKLALIDDHMLFRQGLSNLIVMTGGQYQILFEVANNWQLQKNISTENPPNIIILGIGRQGMDGMDCLQWLKENFPLIKILALGLVEEKAIIESVFQHGAHGYLDKTAEPDQLKRALKALSAKRYYHPHFINGKYNSYAR